MSGRMLPVWCLLLCIVIAVPTSAQDYSNIWNAAHRVLLGLDKATPANAVQQGAEAILNPDSPPNVPDVQVFNPSVYWQSENSIGVNFSDPNQLMVSTNGQIPITPTVVQQTWAFSTDGGITWPAALQSESIPPNILNCLGDPVAFFDRSGRAYYSTIGASGTSAAGMFFVSTTDFGATWSARSNADPNSSSGDDKQHATADFSGTFPNNVYCAWTDFNVTGAPVIFNRSTNQGQTWGTRQVLQIGSNRGQGVHIAIGPNGEVYLAWAHYTASGPEAGIGFAKSTDGGVSFSTPVIAFPITGIREATPSSTWNNVRVNSFPYHDVDRSSGPRRGWIYVTYSDRSSGNSDIYIRRSTDGGATWSAAILVDNEPVGRQQFMSSIAVDPATGGITLSYYNMDSLGTNFMTNRYAAYSVDGGDTWDKWLISDARAIWAPQGTPNTNSTYNGDYYETTAMGGKAWAVWTDRRNGSAGTNNRAYVERIVYGENFGWIKGTVTNVNGGAALGGVALDFVESVLQQGATTNAAGFYLAGALVDTPATTANFTLRARKFGFLDTTLAVTLTRNDTVTRNFAMQPLDLVITKSSITFPPTPVPGLSRDSLVARNQGTIPITLSSLTTTNPDFAVSPTSGTIPVNDSVKIYITYTPSTEGSDTGRVIIMSSSVYTPRKDITLSGTAIGVPHFTANVDSLTRTLEGGARDSVLFRMRNAGTTAGNFSARAIMYLPTGPNGASVTPMVIPMAVSPVNASPVPRPQPSDPISEGVDFSPAAGVSSSMLDIPQYYNYNTGGSANTFPFNVSAGKRIQWLFLAGDFSQPSPAPPGGITKLYFRIATAGTGTFTDLTIKLGQTSITELPAGDWYAGPMQTVYTRASVDLAGNVGDWVTLALDVPFHYDPTQSLVVDVTQCTRVGSGLSTYNTTLTGVRRNASLVGGSCPLPYANTSAIVVHLGMDINPGTWFSVAPTAGSVAIGDSVLMAARFDATDSAVYNNPGNYFGRLEVVATNSSLADTLRVPARLFVVPPPGARISLNADSLDFGDVEIDSSRTLSVLVRNIGASTLNVTGTTISNPNFSATPSAFSLASLDTQRVNVRFTAPSPGATHTGTMQFVSNDPLAPSIGLRGRSIGVAHIVVAPDSFFVSVTAGDSVNRSLVIRNTGLGELTYTSRVNGGFVGADSAAIGSSASNLATSSALIRGGVVQVTTSVMLNQIRSWLTITASRELRWVVYENTTGTSFTKIFESTTTSGTGGPQWFLSGPINITLEAGKRYAIGVNWAAASGLTYFWQASAPVPIPIPFGSITGGLAQSAFPPPATITQGATSSLYYTWLDVSTSQWLRTISGTSGTIASGDSATLGFRAYTNQLPGGIAQASLSVLSNDPFAPTVTVPVVIDVVTGITGDGSQIPGSYTLYQNYPNPFNPVTQIRFGLPQASVVRLKVFNLLGQEVATLADEVRAAGYFVAEWNGMNNAGMRVSSGIYFYRMESTSLDGKSRFTDLKKMILLK